MIACDVTAALLAIFWLKRVANKTVAEGEMLARAETPAEQSRIDAA
jgi:hypothetical protein